MSDRLQAGHHPRKGISATCRLAVRQPFTLHRPYGMTSPRVTSTLSFQHRCRLRVFHEGHGPFGRPLPFPLMCVLHPPGISRATCAVPGPEVEFVMCPLFRRRGRTVLADPSFTPIPKPFRAVR